MCGFLHGSAALDTFVSLAKLQPPRSGADLVARARLEQRLGEALSTRRLTLVCAPAGFGKTAALTRQIRLMPAGTSVAWIAADEGDDLHRFLRCLVLALEPFDLPWRTDPGALIAAVADGYSDLRTAATVLVNALAACAAKRGLVVVDDAHRIIDPEVFAFLQLLIEHLPPRWGFVLSSRVEPPLPLARMRARDELAELRQQDLSFTPDEVASLLAGNGGDSDAAYWHARTGGWAAGLRLTLNAHRSCESATAATHTMDRHMFEFLTAEVLDEMPGELREFLLHCSVLPELTASRCEAVSGNPRAGQLLAEIERRGLFVSVLGGAEPALALHDLFRDCLAERLRRDHPGLLSGLLRRAAETEPDYVRRLSLLQRAGAWDEAEQVLEQAAEAVLADGATEPVMRLIDQFPQERRRTSPILALLRGQVAWERWEWRGMGEETRRAIRGFEAAGDQERLRRAKVFEAIALVGSGWTAEASARLDGIDLEGADVETKALALTLRAWNAIDAGEFDQVSAQYTRVLDVLEQTDRVRIWNHCFQRTLYVWLPGMAGPLARFIDGVMRRSGSAPTYMRAVARVLAAWRALWRGDLDEALERIRQAESDARWFGMPTRLNMFVNTAAAIVYAARGQREQALWAVDAVLAWFPSATPSGPVEQPTSMLAHYLFLGARLADALDDAEALRSYASRLPPPRRIKNYPMLRAPLATIPARLAMHEARYAEAALLWDRLLRDEAALEVLGLAEEVRLRHADALLRIGRKQEAAGEIRRVVHRVRENDELGGVLLSGSAVLRRLGAAAWREELDWTELAMVRGWAQRYAQAPPTTVPDPGPLSARELQVLERVAAGDSNKAIARRLDLSPHTVKRHVANILDKLDVASRSQAAQWYLDNSQ